MKKLRVFYTKNVVERCAGVAPKYNKTQHQEDFPEDTDPQDAYRKLFSLHGSVQDSKEKAVILTGEQTLVAPAVYITINSHAYVEADRDKVVIEGDKAVEQQLFDGVTMFKAQSRKPESTYRPRGK